MKTYTSKELEARLPQEIPNTIILKTKTSYAFLKEYGPKVTISFDYARSETTIPLDHEFTYQGVNFKIINVELGDEVSKVNYEQLTPARGAGGI